MKSIPDQKKYELFPEYSEKSQITDLFTEHKFWGWIGPHTIFILIFVVLYFQLKIQDNLNKLKNKRIKDCKERVFRSKKINFQAHLKL